MDKQIEQPQYVEHLRLTFWSVPNIQMCLCTQTQGLACIQIRQKHAMNTKTLTDKTLINEQMDQHNHARHLTFRLFEAVPNIQTLSHTNRHKD